MLLQDQDTEIDQLLHALAHLPERQEVAKLESELEEHSRSIQAVESERDRLALRQAELEHDIEVASARVKAIEARMYGGQVSASRELEAMANEVTSIDARRRNLEDAELEVMEELDPVERALGDLEAARHRLSEELDEARSRLQVVASGLQSHIADLRQERSRRADGLPTGLLELYERIRSRLGGEGAARLVHGSCTGCHLSLPSVELDRITRAPADEIVTCDQCGRILVR